MSVCDMLFCFLSFFPVFKVAKVEESRHVSDQTAHLWKTLLQKRTAIDKYIRKML